MERDWSHLTLAAAEFTNVAVLLAVSIGIAAAILVLTHLLGPRRRGPVKEGTYESGMEPVGDTRRRFNVRFYLVAVLFLLCDVELIFLYPWALLFPRAAGEADAAHAAWAQGLADAGYGPLYLLGAGGVFLVLLLLGLVYEWRRGVFRWT